MFYIEEINIKSDTEKIKIIKYQKLLLLYIMARKLAKSVQWYKEIINVLFFIAADRKRICESENGSLEIEDDKVRQILKKNGLAT